jgi:hypothetical protein
MFEAAATPIAGDMKPLASFPRFDRNFWAITGFFAA